MRIAHLRAIQMALTDLRCCRESERNYNFGYCAGLIAGYWHAGWMTDAQYFALSQLYLNAFEHSQPGQPAQRSPREV